MIFIIKSQGGTSILGSRGGGGGGGLGPVVKFRGKIWEVQPSSPNKIWEVLLLQDAKVGKESQFWGHLGVYLKFKGQNLAYLSPIFLEAKFRGSYTNFSLKFWGQAPPRPPDMEVPPWVLNHHRGDPAHQHLFKGRGKYSYPTR